LHADALALLQTLHLKPVQGFLNQAIFAQEHVEGLSVMLWVASWCDFSLGIFSWGR
jgi:hypothetical protein